MRRFNGGMNVIDAKRFTWNGCNGYAEASDLRDLVVHQVWNDSCDEGFTVINHEKQTLRTFVKFNQIKDQEGEVTADVFVSICESTGRVDREGVRLAITLWND